MHSYSVFYAYHQYLAHQGFASLAVNFRGGTGYGRDFRNGLYHKMGVDDIADVVAAGHYLKELPWVDEDRVGVWGLSYGGYMTLHALTQYPDEFKMGINLAGIWDFAQWTRWVEERWGKFGGLFKVFLGGDPDESPELYRQASPVTFKDNLCRPLINLHGTDDANVDFEQLDRIVKDCVSLGAEYEAYYYPNEAHMFRHRRTWADAFSRIERELNRYLLEE
jgi:dipeptidyl aminopeptidase/acylaminoacyl peptidase